MIFNCFLGGPNKSLFDVTHVLPLYIYPDLWVFPIKSIFPHLRHSFPTSDKFIFFKADKMAEIPPRDVYGPALST